ncbi:MAG TPA: ABC transporter permease, partial [Polyangia bacterium]
TESLLLSLVGGALGVLVALWGVDALVALAPDALPRANEVALDARVLLFSAGLTLATGVGFGLLPALSASRPDLHDGLRDGARGASATRGRLKRALVVGELALSLVLLVGTGLMLRSFLALRAVDPGLEPAHVLTLHAALPAPKGPPGDEDRARWVAWFARATARLRQLPGVRFAAAADYLPFDGNNSRYSLDIEGRTPASPGELRHVETRQVTAGYFEALGVRVVSGRSFSDGDDSATAPGVVVINQAMARRYFADSDPIGRRVRLHAGKRQLSTIVGVVADVRGYGLDQPALPELYVPYAQAAESSSMALVVRTDGDAAALVGAARAALGEVDAGQPIFDVLPLRELVAQSLAQRYFALVLMLVFAGVALLLAAVGIYGVMSYTVAQRTQEIGIRVALGAPSGSVLKMVVADGMRLVALGLVLGVGGALALTRLLSSMLYGVSATDAPTFAAIAALLALVALTATVIPARRATRVDPMLALRAD